MDVLLSELNDCVPESVALDELLERRRLSELISAWLDTLSRADSALFVRRYWYGESVAALAREAGCTASQLTQPHRCGSGAGSKPTLKRKERQHEGQRKDI